MTRPSPRWPRPCTGGLGWFWAAAEPGGLLSCCRVTVADIEKELAELRESQEQGKAIVENSVSEASCYLQDQVRRPPSDPGTQGSSQMGCGGWGPPFPLGVCVFGGGRLCLRFSPLPGQSRLGGCRT